MVSQEVLDLIAKRGLGVGNSGINPNIPGNSEDLRALTSILERTQLDSELLALVVEDIVRRKTYRRMDERKLVGKKRFLLW